MPLMTLRSLKTASLIVLICVPALLPAQVETSGKEEERLEALARSQGEWNAPKSRLSVGFRILSSGGRVDFKNLGNVPSAATVAPASAGVVQRSYSNGLVSVDSLRPDEKDVDGNQISTPGGRYNVFSTSTVPILDADGTVTGVENVTIQTGNLLSYTPGLTRQWQAATASQISQPGYVAFNLFSAVSDGGSTTKKQGPTGGVEFQLSRELGRGSRHFQWSMLAAIALNDINSKSAGTISSTLHTYTDFYSLNGQTITAENIANPSYAPFYDGNGNLVNNTGTETTVPISAVPDHNTTTDEKGAATIAGRWQVKGAYFMVKIGPSVRTQITNRLGVNASLGLAGGYAGTRYSASESFSVATLPDVVFALFNSSDATDVISSTTTKFLAGYYADLNLEWAANETVGLFGGVTAQKLSTYEQKLGDRTAKIDLGSTVGIRGGVSVRF
jgi:hypothetical protein